MTGQVANRPMAPLRSCGRSVLLRNSSGTTRPRFVGKFVTSAVVADKMSVSASLRGELRSLFPARYGGYASPSPKLIYTSRTLMEIQLEYWPLTGYTTPASVKPALATKGRWKGRHGVISDTLHFFRHGPHSPLRTSRCLFP